MRTEIVRLQNHLRFLETRRESGIEHDLREQASIEATLVGQLMRVRARISELKEEQSSINEKILNTQSKIKVAEKDDENYANLTKMRELLVEAKRIADKLGVQLNADVSSMG